LALTFVMTLIYR